MKTIYGTVLAKDTTGKVERCLFPGTLFTVLEYKSPSAEDLKVGRTLPEKATSQYHLQHTASDGKVFRGWWLNTEIREATDEEVIENRQGIG